jgi:predicted DNA-binding ribbon-helix-helix protein
MNKAIRKHSIILKGKKTSVSLEDAFWHGLRDIAADQKQPISTLISEIDRTRSPKANLSSAIRLYVLDDSLARAQARGAEVHPAHPLRRQLGNAA